MCVTKAVGICQECVANISHESHAIIAMYKRLDKSNIAYQWGLYSMAKDQKAALTEMVQQKYRHPELQQLVLADVLKGENADKIISGELTLPSEHDAARYYSGYAEQEKARHWSQVQRQGADKHDAQAEANAFTKLNEFLKGGE